MRRAGLGVLLFAGLALAAPRLAADPVRELHEIDWFVHVDLIDAGAGQDLAYYSALLAERLAESNVLLEGHQGPVDAGCCVSLDAVSVSTFGTAGDGLDVIQNQPELDAVFAGAPGAYLVQSVWYCAGTTSTSIRGCAQLGGSRMAVGLESEDSDFLPIVIAHERGHNAGLGHVSANPCRLMAASNGGGCLSVGECQSFLADADASGGSCECLADTIGDDPVALGTTCTDTSGCGLCSGGVCGACTELAGASLFAAGGPGTATGAPSNDALVQAGASGDWDLLAAFGATLTGLAHDADAGVLYGIESRAGDDALVIVDADTGAVVSTVGVLGGREQVIALAWDPQPGGGRLFAIEVDDQFGGGPTACADFTLTPPCFSELFEIDPVGAVQTNLGELNSLIITDGVQGLAWDDANALLYGATPAGLVTIDLGSCSGVQCPGFSALDNVFRDPVALSWDPLTGLVVRQGGNGFQATEMDVIASPSGERLVRRGLDPWTAGGLAVRALPEPPGSAGSVAAAALLAALGRRRRAA